MQALVGWQIVALAILAACHTPPTRTAQASEPEAEAVEADQHSEDTSYPHDPDVGDLEPVAPTLAHDETPSYQMLLQELLLGGLETNTWMISAPSFEPEYAIAIAVVPVETPAGASKQPKPDHTCALVLTRATKQVYGQVSSGSSVSMGALRKSSGIERVSIPIDEPSASEISRAWEAVVRRAHYPRPKYVFDENGTRYELRSHMADGTTFSFGSWGYFGETHSPGRGFARDLVVLADKLKAITLEAEANRPARLQECCERARRLLHWAEHTAW